MALPISRLYDFQPNTTIVSSQVDDEFNQLVSTINDLPEKDGTLQSNLNADLLDGFHASNSGGTNTVPVCVSGTIQTNLNADLLDGQHASDIAAAAFDVGTKMLFYQASPPSGWTEVSKPTDHVLGWKSGQAGGTTVANDWELTGFTFGVGSHTLTLAELPNHAHGLGGHTHDMGNHTHTVGDHYHTHDNALILRVVTQSPSSATGSITLSSGGDNRWQNSNFSTLGNVTDFPTGAPSTNTTGSASGSTTGAGSDNSHTHTFTDSHDSSWRPPTAYIIIASKD